MQRISVKLDKSKELVQLGSAIRARRKSLQISQEALADLAGIDRSHLGKIERGERNVTLLNITRIADSLDCKASEILADADL